MISAGVTVVGSSGSVEGTTGSTTTPPTRWICNLNPRTGSTSLPDDTDPTALASPSRYRMPMPCTVDIEFLLPGGERRLWMTASPVDDATCRSFWYLGRTDDLTGDDREHLAFQDRVLAEDKPVVCNQVPREIVLDQTGDLAELSVRTDKVSIEYRRWLRDLALAALDGPSAYAAALARAEISTQRAP